MRWGGAPPSVSSWRKPGPITPGRTFGEDSSFGTSAVCNREITRLMVWTAPYGISVPE